jgi:hypothetical protein
MASRAEAQIYNVATTINAGVYNDPDIQIVGSGFLTLSSGVVVTGSSALFSAVSEGTDPGFITQIAPMAAIENETTLDSNGAGSNYSVFVDLDGALDNTGTIESTNGGNFGVLAGTFTELPNSNPAFLEPAELGNVSATGAGSEVEIENGGSLTEAEFANVTASGGGTIDLQTDLDYDGGTIDSTFGSAGTPGSGHLILSNSGEISNAYLTNSSDLSFATNSNYFAPGVFAGAELNNVQIDQGLNLDGGPTIVSGEFGALASVGGTFKYNSGQDFYLTNGDLSFGLSGGGTSDIYINGADNGTTFDEANVIVSYGKIDNSDTLTLGGSLNVTGDDLIINNGGTLTNDANLNNLTETSGRFGLAVTNIGTFTNNSEIVAQSGTQYSINNAGGSFTNGVNGSMGATGNGAMLDFDNGDITNYGNISALNKGGILMYPAALTNYGDLGASGSTSYFSIQGGSVTNEYGSTIEANVQSNVYLTSNGAVVNQGTIEANNGGTVTLSGSDTSTSNTFNDSTGVVEAINVGQIVLDPGVYLGLGNAPGDVFANNSNSTLTLEGGLAGTSPSLTTAMLNETQAWNGGAIVLDTTLDNSASTLQVGSIVLGNGGPGASPGNLNINGGTIVNGSIEDSGLLGFTSGTGTLSNVTLDAAGTTVGGLNINGGTADITGNLTFNPGDTFNVAAGTLEFANGLTLTAAGSPNNTTLFSVTGAGTLDNETTITASNGNTIDLSAGTLINNGSINATTGGAVNIDPQYQNNDAGVITSTGPGSTVTIGGPGTIYESGFGGVSASNGGTINLAATLDLSNGNPATPGSLNVDTVINSPANPGALNLNDGGVIENGSITNSQDLGFTHGVGTLNNITIDNGLNINGGTALINGAFVYNPGVTFEVDGGGSLELGGSATFNGSNVFDNATVEIDNATPNSGLIIDQGTPGVTLGNSLTIDGSSGVSFDGTTLNVTGAGLTVDGTLSSVNPGFNVTVSTGGTISGTGTIDGPVTNYGGTVDPSDGPGTLTIASGDYTQYAGTLLEEIASPTDYNILDVTNGAAYIIGGDLEVQLDPNANIALNDTFNFLLANYIVYNNFNVVDGPGASGYTFGLTNYGTYEQLTVTGVPVAPVGAPESSSVYGFAIMLLAGIGTLGFRSQAKRKSAKAA